MRGLDVELLLQIGTVLWHMERVHHGHAGSVHHRHGRGVQIIERDRAEVDRSRIEVEGGADHMPFNLTHQHVLIALQGEAKVLRELAQHVALEGDADLLRLTGLQEPLCGVELELITEFSQRGHEGPLGRDVALVLNLDLVVRLVVDVHIAYVHHIAGQRCVGSDTLTSELQSEAIMTTRDVQES